MSEASSQTYGQTYGQVYDQEPQAKDCYSANNTQESVLTLSPLTHHYAQVFYCQYQSPGVIEAVEGEEFASLLAARQYLLAEQKNAAKVSFAIIHQQFGFIGVAGYEYSDDSSCASVFYWLGADVQKRGGGTLALTLLIKQARMIGVHHLFAFTLHHNLASQAVLIKNSFLTLPREITLDEDILGCYLPFNEYLSSMQLQKKAEQLGFLASG